MNFSVGIDFGTSGARIIAIDAARNIRAEARYSFDNATINKSNNLAVLWQNALFSLIEQLPITVRREVKAIAINGTSGTVLLCDENGVPVTTPLLYNDARGKVMMERLKAIAPPHHNVISATSSLAKLLWFLENSNSNPNYYFLHQADWLAFLLHGKLGISDYHNALKLGYDVGNLSYPTWLENLQLPIQLPEVVAPGTPIGEIKPEIASRLNLSPNCVIVAGTTDSIAAFLASGANSPGEAVTSLGSTLVLKLLSTTRVDDPQYGIYSHKFGDLWLVGGASNTGGAVLQKFFTNEELESLSSRIDPTTESPLDYYPLTEKGDRFPINDPNLPPRLGPRPDRSVDFLHGLLESIARIEARGYQLLQQLGATSLSCVYTAGGGAKNPTWTAIRQRHLKAPMRSPANAAAAYGTALLALSSLNNP